MTDTPIVVESESLRPLLKNATPLIDVRSPGEFARGAVPGAINQPILTDDERSAVGQCYRSDGQAAAIDLGERLVAGELRESRVAAWCDVLDAHSGAALYCSRGGLRSQFAQRWLQDRGRPVPRIEGGFKSLRGTCVRIIDEFATEDIWVLGGRTGSGKTALLQDVVCALDLEGLANHRGSAFGATATPQPTPVDFENALAVAILQRANPGPTLLEDESRTIGRLAIPESLHQTMQAAPVLIVEVSRQERAARIYQEYVAEPLTAGTEAADLQLRYTQACDRIKRRLGGLQHGRVRDLIEAAFSSGNDPLAHQLAHQSWIETLLEHYYDPMYDYQLARKQPRVRFSGPPAAVFEFSEKFGIY